MYRADVTYFSDNSLQVYSRNSVVGISLSAHWFHPLPGLSVRICIGQWSVRLFCCLTNLDYEYRETCTCWMSYYRSRMFDKAALYGDRHPLPNVRVKHEYSPPPPGREYLSPPARDYPSPGSVYTPSPPHYSYSPPIPHGDGEVSRNLYRWYGENEHAKRCK